MNAKELMNTCMDMYYKNPTRTIVHLHNWLDYTKPYLFNGAYYTKENLAKNISELTGTITYITIGVDGIKIWQISK